MADNTTLNAGSGGDVIATDDVAGVKYQVVKLDVGGDGASAPVSNSNPVPVSDAGGALTVDGSVSISAVTPGTGATNLGKAIDTATGGTDTGVLALATRDDALTTLTPADGDNTQLRVTSTGALWVTVTNGIAGIADDAAFTVGTNEVLPAGFLADESSTDSVNEGDVGAARITLDRKQIFTPYAHAAAGGATPYKNLDCDETEDDIKTSPGKLFWIHVMNLHASATRYIKFYNATAANVTVGTTTPVLSFPIPANVAGFTVHFGDAGVQFDTAISVAATTGVADNDTGAPGTNEVVLNAGYL